MATTDRPAPPSSADDAPLNPAMKQVHDETYSADLDGADPMATVSVKKDEGRYWPAIWAATTILGIIIAIILIVW